jgi:hypothetical protein
VQAFVQTEGKAEKKIFKAIKSLSLTFGIFNCDYVIE